jgi:hypothetical protein
MNIIDLSKRAWRTTLERKPLWLFAMFMGALNASLSVSGSASERLPLVGILAVGVLVTLLAFAARVLGETALIRGVHRGEMGWLWQESRRLFRPVALIHLGAGFAGFSVWLTMMSPLLLIPLVNAPIALVLALLIPLLALGIPVALTLTFLHAYALRFAVLEDASATEAWTEAGRYLRGRVLESIYVALLASIGRSLLQIALVVFVLPALLAGGATYLLFGVIPGLVVVALLSLPVALASEALAEVFASSMWTHAFLRGRG